MTTPGSGQEPIFFMSKQVRYYLIFKVTSHLQHKLEVDLITTLLE